MKSMAERQSPCMIPCCVVKAGPVICPIFTVSFCLFVRMDIKCSSSGFSICCSFCKSRVLLTVSKALDMSSRRM